jgi:hypothetical protein
MERDIKLLKDAWLKMMFDQIVDWAWEDNTFYLFLKRDSWLSLFAGAEGRFQIFLRAFSQKYDIPIELQGIGPGALRHLQPIPVVTFCI